MTRSDPIPIPAVLAVVLNGADVLLVRRLNPPDAGLWGFPGGKPEMGETLGQAAERELFEETSLVAKASTVLTAVDAFDRRPDGSLRSHFVLVAIACEDFRGDIIAADDASEVAWVPVSHLSTEDLQLSSDVEAVARLALARRTPR